MAAVLVLAAMPMVTVATAKPLLLTSVTQVLEPLFSLPVQMVEAIGPATSGTSLTMRNGQWVEWQSGERRLMSAADTKVPTRKLMLSWPRQ